MDGSKEGEIRSGENPLSQRANYEEPHRKQPIGLFAVAVSIHILVIEYFRPIFFVFYLEYFY